MHQHCRLQLLISALVCLHRFVYCQDGHDRHTESDSCVHLKGHLQPFGESGSRVDVNVADKFPEPKDFFRDYVQQSRPLKLPGVAKSTRAFRMWNDDYLLSLDLPEGDAANVHLETRKKENRTQDTLFMNFHEFLKVYNDTEYYMVDDVPAYLRGDVMVPCSLQCRQLLDENMAFALMWFSSGGTNSVVHTDSFDNINCIFRGEKTFVMVDPTLHREKVDLNNQGSHSDIDVDSVDLRKYPKLAEVEFYHINMTAGDCLYIPHRWIHQVRSYNSNVAVNFWWNHYSSVELFRDGLSCLDVCDPELTLKYINLKGDASIFEHYVEVRDWLTNLLISSDRLSRDHFLKIVLNEELEMGEIPEGSVTLAALTFDQLDANKDGVFTYEEAKQTPDQVWKQTAKDVAAIVSMFGEQAALENRDENRDENLAVHAREDL